MKTIKKQNPFVIAAAAGFITLNLAFGFVSCNHPTSSTPDNGSQVQPSEEEIYNEALRNIAIADANNLVANEYTTESYAAVETALDMPQDTLEEVNAKTTAITDAITGLEEKSITPAEITVDGVNLSETIIYDGTNLLTIENTGPKVSGNLTLKLNTQDPNAPTTIEFDFILQKIKELQEKTTGKAFVTTGGLSYALDMNTITTQNLPTGQYGNIHIKPTQKELFGGNTFDYKEVTIAPNTKVSVEGDIPVDAMEINKGAGSILTAKDGNGNNVRFTQKGGAVNISNH